MSHCSAADSSAFRARVECVLQAVMAHTAIEMVRLFEEAVEALRAEGLQSRGFNLESILSTSDAAENTDTPGPADDETAAELAVEQVLSGEEALSVVCLFGPVEDDDCTVAESPDPSQARDVNLTGPWSHVRGQRVKMTGPPHTAVRGAVKMNGPSSHTAVRDVEHKENMRLRADTTISVSEEGSQTFPVTAVKTEEDDMDDDYGGYCDSRSHAEPECSYNTEELPEDGNTYYATEKKMMTGQSKKRKRGARCRICRKTYYSRQATHLKECTGVLVYKCDYCGMMFDRLSSLTHHTRSHNRDKYSCTVCGKTFVYDKCRILHERKEHSNMKYRCSDCGKTFEELLERDHHECMVFTGSFEFSCTECNKGFNRQYILKKHQLAEHPEMFDNNQETEMELSKVPAKMDEDYERDMYGYEQDMDLQDYWHDIAFDNQDYEQDIGLNNQAKEPEIDINNQVNEQDMGLNSQAKEPNIGLKLESDIDQAKKLDIDQGKKLDIDQGKKLDIDQGKDIDLNNQVNE